MTNKSKALEIYNRETDKGFHLGTHSLLEMAQWKDQQFKEYLERKRDALAEISRHDFYDISNTFGGVKCLDEIINELFKEE